VNARTSRASWCDAGLALLRDDGYAAVTIERLCAAVGRTKGSFYHHFRNMDAYLEALLERWEQELTEMLIHASASESEPKLRDNRLDQLVRRMDHRLDSAVRAWAQRDPRAQAAVKRVDKRRTQHLERLFRARGLRPARLLAELEYLAFVGAQQLAFFATPRHLERLFRAHREALGLLAEQHTRRAPPAP
jgi:AcrR family transcriptional regulator